MQNLNYMLHYFLSPLKLPHVATYHIYACIDVGEDSSLLNKYFINTYTSISICIILFHICF